MNSYMSPENVWQRWAQKRGLASTTHAPDCDMDEDCMCEWATQLPEETPRDAMARLQKAAERLASATTERGSDVSAR